MITLSNWLLFNSDGYSLIGQHWARILKTRPLSHHFFSTTLIHSSFPQNNKRRLSWKTFSLRQISALHEPVQGASSLWKLPTAFAISGNRMFLGSFMQTMTFITGDVDISHQNPSFIERLCFLLLSAWLTALGLQYPFSWWKSNSGYFARFNINEMQN